LNHLLDYGELFARETCREKECGVFAAERIHTLKRLKATPYKVVHGIFLLCGEALEGAWRARYPFGGVGLRVPG
jgi:hypothetical protein